MLIFTSRLKLPKLTVLNPICNLDTNLVHICYSEKNELLDQESLIPHKLLNLEIKYMMNDDIKQLVHNMLMSIVSLLFNFIRHEILPFELSKTKCNTQPFILM